MKRFSVFAFALLALTPFAFDGALEAAEPGAWWAAADFWLAEASNLNLDVAAKHEAAYASGGEIIGLDIGSEFSGRLRGGWRPDDPTGTGYSISIWSWSGDDSLEVDDLILPAVSDPLFNNDSSESVESAVDVGATIVDLMLSRRLAATRKSSWYWGAGLRHASYDMDWWIDYFDPFFLQDAGYPNPDVKTREDVEIHVKSSGIGFTAGLGGTYTWSPRWRTHARAQLALLKGETEASYKDRGYIDDMYDDPPLYYDTGKYSSVLERPGDDRVFYQVEIEARIIFQIMEGLDVSLGYALMNWADAQQVDRLLDDVQGGLSFTSDDVAFDGFLLSVSYVFR